MLLIGYNSTIDNIAIHRTAAIKHAWHAAIVVDEDCYSDPDTDARIHVFHAVDDLFDVYQFEWFTTFSVSGTCAVLYIVLPDGFVDRTVKVPFGRLFDDAYNKKIWQAANEMREYIT